MSPNTPSPVPSSAPAQPIAQADPVKVLLVDDEATLREPLAEYLTAQGFAVTEAENATEVRSILAQADANPSAGAMPDIVLLDIMMPGEDGLSLCRHLVETRALPVLFLTAKTEAMDRILGLEMGADDYILKPFEPRELVARIRTVLRRVARGAAAAPAAQDWHYVFEEWELDPLKRKLTDPEGITIPISTAEFRLLRAFLDHPRSVMDRDVLLDMVQGRTAHLFDRAVDNQISRLRRKIEKDSRNPQYIQTVRGGGYRFAASVARVAPQAAQTGG